MRESTPAMISTVPDERTSSSICSCRVAVTVAKLEPAAGAVLTRSG